MITFLFLSVIVLAVGLVLSIRDSLILESRIKKLGQSDILIRDDFNRIIRNVMTRVDQVDGIARSACGKVDSFKHEIGNNGVFTDIKELFKRTDALKDVAVVHADHLDMIAKASKLKFVNETKTVVTKEYQKTK